MIKATIEIDNGTHVVLLQDEEGNKMVTSVLPLLDMIKSGKDILVEGDNVVAGKGKDYIINLKENIDILEDIKEMVGYFYSKIHFEPSRDIVEKMNEATEPMLKLKSNNGMINRFLKCDFMTVNENIGTYYFFYKDKVAATCDMKSYDSMTIAITPREWITELTT